MFNFLRYLKFSNVCNTVIKEKCKVSVDWYTLRGNKKVKQIITNPSVFNNLNPNKPIFMQCDKFPFTGMQTHCFCL